MYGSRGIAARKGSPTIVGLVRWSKSCLYETPHDVTGIIKLTGLEEQPKGIICTDMISWNVVSWLLGEIALNEEV